MKKICVIGSFNIDMITSTDRFPAIGETVFSNTFDLFIGGGKGANQAVALGRLGADVMMAGKLGDKFYGPEYIQVLERNNVRKDAVEIEMDTYPGLAIVAVDKNSDNILFVFSGANMKVDITYIERNWEAISSCDIFLLQLEIPLETNAYLMEKLKELNKIIILDPAPAAQIPDSFYRCSAFVTPNENELKTLTGIDVQDEEDFRKAGVILLQKGAKTVIAKAGKQGAYIIAKDQFVHVPGFKVKSVDPTAAGDTFNAGLAYAISQGKDIYESVVFANAAAALSTTAIGAQNAMPDLEAVNRFLDKHKQEVSQNEGTSH